MGSMDRGTNEERRRVKSDFSLAIDEIRYSGGRRDGNSMFAELLEAEKELKADTEKNFHFKWHIVDGDEAHIYVTNMKNGHRYHISVIYPAALYVDVYCINEDGTECRVF